MLSNPDRVVFKERLEKSVENSKNPFKDAYLWAKGEFLDIKSMHDCLHSRESILKAQIAAEERKKNSQKELDKMTQGKTTLKSVFKSKGAKEERIKDLNIAIENTETEIQEFR